MTTRELTPAQTAEALDLLRKIINRKNWQKYGIDGESTTCIHCGAYWHDGVIAHKDYCPVTRATALLAAVDSAQEAD